MDGLLSTVMVEGLLFTFSFVTVTKYGINCGLGSCKNMSLSLEACIVECWMEAFLIGLFKSWRQ